MNGRELAYYSAALDEIFRLRGALAHEARLRSSDLDLRSYPAGRRRAAEQAVRRMIAAARGDARSAYQADGVDYSDALMWADADHGLSRWQWEREVDRHTTPQPGTDTGEAGPDEERQ